MFPVRGRASAHALTVMFFKIPGRVAYGQQWLNIKFAKSVVRVPFRILTKHKEKLLSRNDGDIRKQVQEAFKPPKKKS